MQRMGGGMMTFNYALQVLSFEIQKVDMLQKEQEKRQLEFVVEILTSGQGYLTNTKPKKIIFFDET